MSDNPLNDVHGIILEGVNTKLNLGLTVDNTTLSSPVLVNPAITDFSTADRNTRAVLTAVSNADFKVTVNYNRLSMEKLFGLFSLNFEDQSYNTIGDMLPAINSRTGAVMTVEDVDAMVPVAGGPYPRVVTLTALPDSLGYYGNITLQVTEPDSGSLLDPNNMALWFWAPDTDSGNSWTSGGKGGMTKTANGDGSNTINWQIGGLWTENISNRLSVLVEPFTKNVVAGQTTFKTQVTWTIDEAALAAEYVNTSGYLTFWYAYQNNGVMMGQVKLFDSVDDGQGGFNYVKGDGDGVINFTFPQSFDLSAAPTEFEVVAFIGTTADPITGGGDLGINTYSALGQITLNPFSINKD